MRVVIAGGSGFLGRALQSALQHRGHQIAVLTRSRKAPHHVEWRPDGSAGPWADSIDGADALINLAGEGIADKRWTQQRKETLRRSRLLPTRSLVTALQRVAKPPAVFVSASAVGYYGAHGDEPVVEATPPGSDFLAQLCVEWEREAEQASSLTRVALLRSGIVLNREGGALAKMLLPFKLGVGGRLGSGRQYMPWIHLHDWVDLVVLLLSAPGARGAFNLTAPAPATNAEFTRALGRALGRPTIFPVPAIGLRVLFGELSEALLTGQRAVPARAQELGFAFSFDQIEPALRDLLR